MQKKKKSQKKSMVFATAMVITGCIVTAVYVNYSMERTSDYKVDLAKLDMEEKKEESPAKNPDFNIGAPIARVSGKDVVNQVPEKTENKKEERKEEPEKEEEIAETSSDAVALETADLSFKPEDKMGWPVVGDVILNYSMDQAVYFATLEQYKYNPAILISAEEGSNVSASAKGQVVKIGETSELGKYVVMDLGDGYEVTYGQLCDLQVKEGDVVARGQVIGCVAKESKYYAVEGSHVYLKLTKEGEPQNPLEIMS